MTPVTRKCPKRDSFGGVVWGMWRMLFPMGRFMPLDSLSSVWHDTCILGKDMTATTYELINESSGNPVLKCLLCHGESSGADDVRRLYCTHCAWFHEPVDETRLNMLRHVQTALEEAQIALEMAKSLADDSDRTEQLTVAHRELRRALSRA